MSFAPLMILNMCMFAFGVFTTIFFISKEYRLSVSLTFVGVFVVMIFAMMGFAKFDAINRQKSDLKKDVTNHVNRMTKRDEANKIQWAKNKCYDKECTKICEEEARRSDSYLLHGEAFSVKNSALYCSCKMYYHGEDKTLEIFEHKRYFLKKQFKGCVNP